MRRLAIFAIAALFMVAAVPAASFAAVKAGSVAAVSGDVRVQHEGADSSVTLRKGDTLYVHDTIMTGRNGKARLAMLDNSILSLGRNTNLVVREYSIDDKTNQRTSVLGLLKGKLRTLVQKAYKAAGSKFEVHTPTAVAGVRSTDTGYTVSDDGTTRIFTFEGTTYVITTNPDGSTTITDHDAGQVITTLEGNVAGEVRNMNDSDLSEFMSDVLGLGDQGDQGDGGDGDGEGDGEGDEGDDGTLNPGANIPTGGSGGGSTTSPNEPTQMLLY